MRLHIFLFFSKIGIIYSANLRINPDRSCSSGSIEGSFENGVTIISNEIHRINSVDTKNPSDFLDPVVHEELQTNDSDINPTNLLNSELIQKIRGGFYQEEIVENQTREIIPKNVINLTEVIRSLVVSDKEASINSTKINKEETTNLRGTILEKFSNFGESLQNKAESYESSVDLLYLPIKCILPQHIKANHCLAPSYLDKNNITPNRLNYYIYYENYYSKLNWLEREFFNKNCTNYSYINLNEKSLEYYRSSKLFNNEQNIFIMVIVTYFLARIILSSTEALILAFITCIIVFSNIKK